MPSRRHWCIITCCQLTTLHVVLHSPFGDHCLVAHLWHRHIWMLILIRMTHFVCTFAKLQKVTIGFITPVCLPVCPPSAWNSLAPTGQILMKFDILVFFENQTKYECRRWRYNMAQEHCMLDNTYCFSIATMVTRTYLNVKLYVHCPSCSGYLCYVPCDGYDNSDCFPVQSHLSICLMAEHHVLSTSELTSTW